jgi:GT2 family glycosyltransferase
MVNEAHNNPLVSVAILTWNRRQQVFRAIESVLKQTYRPIELVVVDSASTDGTVDAITTAYPSVKVIRLHRNLGCPEGRNVALANCTGDVLYALDDDGWLAENTLQVCVDRFNENPRLGVVCCRVLPPGTVIRESGHDEVRHTFDGGASAFRKKILQTAGFYPSDFFRQGEEGDLALRIIEAGYSILYCPEAIMFHETVSVNRINKLFWYYGCRNELTTVLRRYPWALVVPIALQKIAVWTALGITQGALTHTFWGVCHVFTRLPQVLRERKPVSFATVREVFRLKIAYKRNAWTSSGGYHDIAPTQAVRGKGSHGC